MLEIVQNKRILNTKKNIMKYYLLCLQRQQPYGGWEDLEPYTLSWIMEILVDYHSIDNDLSWYLLRDMLAFEWGLYLDKEFEKEVDYNTIEKELKEIYIV